MPQKEVITPADFGASGPPISPGIKVGNMVYVSGQIGRHPSTGKIRADLEVPGQYSLSGFLTIAS
jgi:enamine deaminase RidA (YjgF/YER057c/UK114 family)